ncbi:MAG: iron-containing alcohol dehydrogenase [Desulfobacterales bacterium]|nr:iron-containing alcohol dehydrogenase [Desulfobacterales bacterium]MBS3755576.1 iron-containing alcohol dehydrogenase [Desulfobacterales bacterium]
MQNLHYEFYSQPKITSGACALESIPTELASNDAHKPLVITGREHTRRGLDKTLIRAFADSGCPLGGIFDEIRDYAGISLARQAAVLFAERGCDAIVAVGGGPVADVARAANLLVSHDTQDLFQFFNGSPPGKRLKPFIHIPACCTNGSESGKTITVDNRRLTSNFLYPDAIILDKRMTAACTRRCAAQSALTTMDNAVTAFLDGEHSPMKDAFAHAGVGFAAASLKKAIKRPKNRKHSLAMANAGVMAGIAAANAAPGVVRGLAEELEKITGIARGVFIRIFTPAALAWMTQKTGPPGDDLLLAAGGMAVYAKTPEQQRPQKGVEMFLALLDETRGQIPETLSSLHIPAYRLEKACVHAGSRKDFPFSPQDCLEIIKQTQKGGGR